MLIKLKYSLISNKTYQYLQLDGTAELLALVVIPEGLRPIDMELLLGEY